jgi:sigma54-dependent transcription regulator
MGFIDRLAQSAAKSRISVLLLGEPASSRAGLARALHEQGPRRQAPFVTLDCAALRPDSIEGALFGIAPQLPGVFERALGGTLFLDSIDTLSPRAQSALLRALDRGKVRRVGTTDEVAVDVRVVAGSPRDLGALAAAGAFRLDLLHRLNALTIRLAPSPPSSGREQRSERRGPQPDSSHVLEPELLQDYVLTDRVQVPVSPLQRGRRVERRSSRQVVGLAHDLLRGKGRVVSRRPDFGAVLERHRLPRGTR